MSKLGNVTALLARDDRQEMVKVLSAEGMSTRAIGPIVGADHSTVVRDLATGANAPVAATPITGMNGKTYFRPEPQSAPVDPPKPRRRPITEQAAEAGWETRGSFSGPLQMFITHTTHTAN